MRRRGRFERTLANKTRKTQTRQALAVTRGQQPFLIPQCREFNLDGAKLESMMLSDPKPLMGYDRATQQVLMSSLGFAFHLHINRKRLIFCQCSIDRIYFGIARSGAVRRGARRAAHAARWHARHLDRRFADHDDRRRVSRLSETVAAQGSFGSVWFFTETVNAVFDCVCIR